MDIFHTKPIAKFIKIAMVLLFFACCKNQKAPVKNSVSIKFIHSLDVVNPDDGKLFTLKDSINIFYLENYILYEMPIYATLTDEKISRKKGESNQITVKHEIRHYYIIYKEKNEYGYMFDSLAAKNPHKILVDSFLKESAFKGFPFYNKSDNNLFKTTYNNANHTLIKTYAYKNKIDSSYPDSM